VAGRLNVPTVRPEPHAVERGGEITVYGPGGWLAGTVPVSVPLDADPETAREAREDDDALVAHWLRLLVRQTPQIAAAVAERRAGDPGPEERLREGLQRSAEVQLQLDTLEGIVDRVLTAGGFTPSERTRGPLLRLLTGGRDARTVARWRSGEMLVPGAAHDYLSRIRHVQIHGEPGARYVELRLAIEDGALAR